MACSFEDGAHRTKVRIGFTEMPNRRLPCNSTLVPENAIFLAGGAVGYSFQFFFVGILKSKEKDRSGEGQERTH
jgi:hypothetical protein